MKKNTLWIAVLIIGIFAIVAGVRQIYWAGYATFVPGVKQIYWGRYASSVLQIILGIVQIRIALTLKKNEDNDSK